MQEPITSRSHIECSVCRCHVAPCTEATERTFFNASARVVKAVPRAWSIESQAYESNPKAEGTRVYTRSQTKRPSLQGAKRHARPLAGAADAGYRDCSRIGASRQAMWCAYRNSSIVAVPRVLPNPSLKRSANGMAHRSSSAGPAAHFALAAQRAMPSSPA